MKIIYIADDGKQFDDEWECENYEFVIKHPSLKDICFYDENGNMLDDVLDQNTYEYAMKIIVPTDEAAKSLYELEKYAGFCAYRNIDSAGTWVWENGLNGRFVKI